jgi:predicted TIM-barrel fold metal-dependent hydrolase
MIIDLNNMWMPENFFRDEALMNSFFRSCPRIFGENISVVNIPGKKEKQVVLAKPKGYDILNFDELMCDPDARLEYMDKAGVDISVLSLPIWEEWLDLETCKKVNNMLHDVVKKHPDRYVALAIVPPYGDKECLKELERCIKELGCCGVEMAAHYGTLYHDNELFRPHFKKISQLNVPVRVHHTPMPVDYQHIYEYTNLRRSFGRCVDVMTSLGRVIFSDLLEQFPNLTFTYTHIGGGFFAYTNMMAPPQQGVTENVDRVEIIGDKIRKYMKNNIYHDITSPLRWTKGQLELAINELGADHVLYSSCYPVRMGGITKGIEYMKELNISKKELDLVMGGAAAKLYNIKVKKSKSK